VVDANALISRCGRSRCGVSKKPPYSAPCGQSVGESRRRLRRWSAYPVPDTLARVRDEVLPDVAIYRSQLSILFPEVEASPSLVSHPASMGAGRKAEPLFRVVLGSVGQCPAGSYLEPREHGVASPVLPTSSEGHCASAGQAEALATALRSIWRVRIRPASRAYWVPRSPRHSSTTGGRAVSVGAHKRTPGRCCPGARVSLLARALLP